MGQYKIQNKILVTLNNSKNVNISKIKRDFLTNSSCGVCGKTSLDALETLKQDKPKYPTNKINKNIIIKSPEILSVPFHSPSSATLSLSNLFIKNVQLIPIFFVFKLILLLLLFHEFSVTSKLYLILSLLIISNG